MSQPLPTGVVWDERRKRFHFRLHQDGKLVSSAYFSVAKYGSKTLAREQATLFAAAQRRRQILGEDLSADTVTLNQLIDRYVEAKAYLQPKSRQQIRTQLYHLAPLFGRPARSLTIQDIAGHRARLGARLGATTVRHVFSQLRAVLELGVEQHLLADNVARQVSLPDRASPAIPLTVSEVRRLHEVASTPWIHLAISLIADCALRPGELCALRWDDLTAEGDRLEVRRSRASIHADGTPKLAVARVDTKSRAGVRPVPTTERLRAELAAWRRICPSQTWIFPAPGDPSKVLCVQSFDRAWRRLLTQAGLPQRRAYDLRHTSITRAMSRAMAADSKANVRDVATWAGQAHPSTTLSIYTHMMGGVEAMRGVMDGAWEMASFFAGEFGRRDERSDDSVVRLPSFRLNPARSDDLLIGCR